MPGTASRDRVGASDAGGQDRSRPTANARNGSRPRTADDAAYAHSQRFGVGGRSGANGLEVPPTRTAGEPAQRCPARTRPNTADPGAISAPRPIFVPGASVLRVPIVASAPDADAADANGVAVDPVAGEVDFGFDRGAVGDLEHARDRRDRVQVDVRAELRTERSGVVDDPRCAGQADRVDLVRDLLGEPEPQMHAAAARVVARLHAGEQQSGGRGRRRHPAERGHEEDESDEDEPQRRVGEELEAREQAQDPARGEQPERSSGCR